MLEPPLLFKFPVFPKFHESKFRDGFNNKNKQPSLYQKQEEKRIQINKKVVQQEDEEGEYSTRLLDKEVRMCRKTRS
jgi:hypothetical protein